MPCKFRGLSPGLARKEAPQGNTALSGHFDHSGERWDRKPGSKPGKEGRYRSRNETEEEERMEA